jgi:hypothetical protein
MEKKPEKLGKFFRAKHFLAVLRNHNNRTNNLNLGKTVTIVTIKTLINMLTIRNINVCKQNSFNARISL